MSQSQQGAPGARTDRILAGRYRLGALLGSGGMAAVYSARDESLGRTVAVKLFHADLTNARDERRQAEEIALLASLNHPALVTLFDAGKDSDGAFLVMELVEGADLRTRLGTGPLDSREAARIGCDVASALAHIHQRGVVHRDVKPANILLPAGAGAEGVPRAKLADFGIARLIDSTQLTATGTLLGTAAFLSPEQAAGGSVGPATDVYSLALVLLEALTGERAFPGTAVESSVARLGRDPHVPESLGPEWGTLLRQATARQPDDRPTAEELASRLRALASDDSTLLLPLPARSASASEATEPLDAPPEAPTERLAPAPAATGQRRMPRIRRPLVIGAGVVAAVLIAGAVILTLPSAPEAESVVPVVYPAVEGDLGAHLAELQNSVEP